jgi:hypothetical protein
MAKNKDVIRDINLLPGEYREKEKFNLGRVLLVLLILLLFAGSGYMYFSLENEIFTKVHIT